MILYILMMAGILIAGLFRTGQSNPIEVRQGEFGGIEIRRKSYYAIFILFMLWFFLAFRASVIGSDTPRYVETFDRIAKEVGGSRGGFWSNLFVADEGSRYETGYIVLNRIVALFTDNSQWILILVATFCMFVCYRFVVNESKEIMLSLFLFVSLRLYYFLMSGLRQAIAIYICLIAYRFIKQRKLIPFILLVILATQFHVTAIVFLIAYPISYFKFNFQNILWMGAAGVAVFVGFNSILGKVLTFLPEYYSEYQNSERFESYKTGNIIVAIIQVIFLVISIFSKYGMDHSGRKTGFVQKEFDEASFMKFMLLVSILFSLVSLRATTLDRLYYYFWIFSIICIPNMLQEIERDTDRATLTVGTVVFTFLYNIVLLYFRPDWTNITPYLFFWQE